MGSFYGTRQLLYQKEPPGARPSLWWRRTWHMGQGAGVLPDATSGGKRVIDVTLGWPLTSAPQKDTYWSALEELSLTFDPRQTTCVTYLAPAAARDWDYGRSVWVNAHWMPYERTAGWEELIWIEVTLCLWLLTLFLALIYICTNAYVPMHTNIRNTEKAVWGPQYSPSLSYWPRPVGPRSVWWPKGVLWPDYCFWGVSYFSYPTIIMFMQ